MKRVLIVSNYGWTLFNFRRRLIAQLQAEGWQVHAQTEFDGYQDKLGISTENVLALDIDRKGINPLRDMRTVLSIVNAVRGVKADVCLLFTIKPIVYGGLACRLARVPYIANVTGLGTAFIGGRWLRRVAVLLYKIGLRAASRVFFQNKTDMDLFIREHMVRSDQAALLPGSGVDLDRFIASAYPDHDGITFLLIGRMLRDKGVQEFADATQIVKNVHPRARFQLLGPMDPINRTAIGRATIDRWVEHGIVQYLGESDDVRPYIAQADCVVLPSYREGAPRSLLEAAAMARPVIATDAVGCRDVVDDRLTGLLCKIGDARDLASKMLAMASLSREERARMGSRGRQKMEQEFDERIVLRRYVEAIRSLDT